MSVAEPRGSSAAPLALLAGLVPLAGVNISWLLSTAGGHIPDCFTYVEGCTSVSATGRHPPASFVFRGTMIPGAVFMTLYWHLASGWLRRCYGDQSLRARLLPWFGWIAGVFLVVYATVLGHIGEVYEIQRRIGVTMFFAFTMFAQLLFTSRLDVLRREGRLALAAWIVHVKTALCAGMIGLGLGSIAESFLVTSGDRTVERIIEWNYALLMILFFVVTWFAWRATDFRVGYSVAPGTGRQVGAP